MFVLDIETLPDETKLEVFDKFHKDGYTVEHGAEGYEAWRSGQMSLMPMYAKLAGLGFWVAKHDEPVSVMVGDSIRGIEVTEKMLLEKFWQLQPQHGPCCGFNVIDFDVKIIRLRSMALGVTPTVDLREIKPWEKDKLRDLAHLLYPDKKRLNMKQTFELVCPHVQIPEKYGPVADFNGSMVYEKLKEAGGRDVVRLYQEFDVWREMWLDKTIAAWF